ncbi:hypothetical protein ABH15_01020 [Methanoculleus taiwanensis]|uniref:STAS domain-containing protein n=1 Tax=Methanoculleus taiwanensis TaxID=1550565 RepID=A0A498H1R9_9EURY|nr:STAS domain-containing protein [Methanoculleus taiwanensis]RXE56782.1 hypothetical protein ABH15_01020 [Methanoculleus taiwanensis]
MDVEVREQDGAAIVTVEGRIDAASAEGLDEALTGVIGRGTKKVLINLEKAVYMSSSGLRVLLAKFKGLKREEGEMALCAPNADVYKVFTLAGVHEVFPIYMSMDEVFVETSPGRGRTIRFDEAD